MTKTIYILRTRFDETENWEPPVYYRKRSKRDKDEQTARCLAGIRTFTYSERKTADEIAQLELEDENE